jgi:hypothetical protein
MGHYAYQCPNGNHKVDMNFKNLVKMIKELRTFSVGLTNEILKLNLKIPQIVSLIQLNGSGKIMRSSYAAKHLMEQLNIKLKNYDISNHFDTTEYSTREEKETEEKKKFENRLKNKINKRLEEQGINELVNNKLKLIKEEKIDSKAKTEDIVLVNNRYYAKKEKVDEDLADEERKKRIKELKIGDEALYPLVKNANYQNNKNSNNNNNNNTNKQNKRNFYKGNKNVTNNQKEPSISGLGKKKNYKQKKNYIKNKSNHSWILPEIEYSYELESEIKEKIESIKKEIMPDDTTINIKKNSEGSKKGSSFLSFFRKKKSIDELSCIPKEMDEEEKQKFKNLIFEELSSEEIKYLLYYKNHFGSEIVELLPPD